MGIQAHSPPTSKGSSTCVVILPEPLAAWPLATGPPSPQGPEHHEEAWSPPKPLRTPPSLDPTGCWGIWPHRRQIQETGLGKSEGWEYRDAPVLPPALCHLDEDMFPPWGGPPSPHDC